MIINTYFLVLTIATYLGSPASLFLHVRSPLSVKQSGGTHDGEGEGTFCPEEEETFGREEEETFSPEGEEVFSQEEETTFTKVRPLHFERPIMYRIMQYEI